MISGNSKQPYILESHDLVAGCRGKCQFPEYKKATPFVFILHPGEVILIPKGWWHYAVALETSITAQRNWYHAASNGKDFVKFVVKQVEKAKHQAKQRSNR